MISKDDENNPFVAYLKQEGITPGDFAIIARVDNVSVYDARKAHCRALPKSFIPAIDERSGKGKRLLLHTGITGKPCGTP